MNENILPENMEVGKLLINLEDIEKNSGRLINKKFFDGNNAKSSKYIFDAVMYFTENCASISIKLSLLMMTVIALQKFCL